VQVEWDERKRDENLRRHGVDFLDAALIFEGPVIEGEDVRRGYGEPRWRAVGHSAGRDYLVAYTRRGDARRLISAWRIGHESKARYQKLFARATQGDAGAG
jgi:uncharacterized DUF497 family protein